MSYIYHREGYYVSDGSLFYVNDQSANERSYIQVDAGVRVCFLYNGSGRLYAYMARPGSQGFSFVPWHTTTAGGEPEPEDPVGAFGYTTAQYKGHSAYYIGNYWYSPAPIPAPGLVVFPYTDTASERLKTAMHILFRYFYDKPSFLAGLAVGRALWRPPEVTE